MATIAPADSTLSLLWDSTRLRLLVELEKQGSVSAAARAVGIGQPSASEHLRLLEAAAGQRLVEAKRPRQPADGGRTRALASRSQRWRRRRGGAARARRPRTGTIHIGASTTPGVYVLPETLGCFQRDHPNVSIEVEIASTGEIIERLLSGRIHLALVGDTATDERISSSHSSRTRSWASRSPVSSAGPREGEAGGARRAHAARPRGAVEHPAGRRPRASCGRRRAARVWELDSSEAIKRAAREGLGVAFVSLHAVAEEVERGELECFRLAGHPRIERHFHIARLARRPSPSEKRFVATITRCTKDAHHAAAIVS